MDYSRLFGSKFPEEPIQLEIKKDVDDNVISIINDYYSFIEQGQTDKAYDLYDKNRELLDKYSIKADDINRIKEEIYNIGVKVLTGMQTAINPTEPTNQIDGQFWYKIYE